MSWSTGSSAPGYRAATGRRDAGTDAKSPVRYREGAMAYEPARYCRCEPQRKAPRWISWSKLNPGRRYYACIDALRAGGGCGYVEWHDRELPKFFSDLIGDLRDEVWRLKGVGNVAPTEDFSEGVQAVAQEPVMLHDAVMVQMLQQKVEVQDAELKAIKGKYKTVMFGFVVFVLGLVLGKMVLQ